jgi:hypothetical protein
MSTTNKETKVETSARKEAAPVKRGGYRGNRGNRYKPAAITVTRELKFNGKCDSLIGFVYDCSYGKQSDRFNIVTKEIAEYVGREYPYGGDIRWTIQNLELFKEEEPSELAASSSVLKNYVGKTRGQVHKERKQVEGELPNGILASYRSVHGVHACQARSGSGILRHGDTATWRADQTS